MTRIWLWLILAIGVGGLCWAYPPVHIRSTKATRQAVSNAQFSAKDFVSRFWNDTLLPAADGATQWDAIVEAMATKPPQVREKFGHTVGLSSSYFLFLRGTGRVVSADADNIGLSLKADGTEADVVVPLGFVFGNAVRDGTGLLSSSSYPNAQEFNDISSQLNEIVETKVLPEFQRVATIEKRIRFAGCVEVADEEADLKPLKLVPVYVKAE